MDREEGEMSDDNAMIVDDDIKPELVKQPDEDHTMLYKAEKNRIIVKQLEKVDAVKLEERAKRFGLDLSGNRVVTQKQIDELYVKSGIESGNERHFRFDTLHLNGIDGLTTREIFEYLEDFKPVSLEKIDDVSCNIVCQDHISAALALLVHSREIKNEQINEMLKEKSHHHWREGMPHPKKDLILMRFSTNADKKVSSKSKIKENEEKKHPDEYYNESMDSVSKNPWGDLCKSWGVYDHQEVFLRRLPKHDYEDDIAEPVEKVQIRNKKLAGRLGKRRFKVEESEDSSSDSEWKKKSKTPRMRMHADDVESKQKKKPAKRLSSEDESYSEEVKDAFAPLSIEVVNTKNDYRPRESTKLSEKFKFHNNTSTKTVGNILSRLGVKVQPTTPREQPLSDEDSSAACDHFVSSRVQKVKSTAKPTSSVWSRLDKIAKVSEKDNSQKDLRQIIKSKKDTRPDDLRERISQAKKSNLRIEIDNYK